MTRVALLSNPDSGSGEAGSVADCLRSHGLDVVEFGLDDIDGAFATDPERVVVAGGDGSLACVGAPASRAGIPMAVIPTGTANDFARALEIPQEVEAACAIAAEGTGRRTLELGWMNDRPFLNVASMGLSPDAAERADGLKESIGPLAYSVGALGAGLQAEAIECVVRCGDREIHSGEAWQVTVACTGAFGGGSSVEADPEDGDLDVFVIEAGPRARLAKHAVGLKRGEIGEQKGVTRVRCPTAEIEFAGERTFNVDGELLEAGSAKFRAEPDAVEVIVG